MTKEERKETEVPDWLKAKPYYNEAFIDFIENVCDEKLSVCQKDVCCYMLKKVERGNIPKDFHVLEVALCRFYLNFKEMFYK